MSKNILSTGKLLVSPDEHSVFANGEKVMLTLKEFELLRIFMENPGRVFSRDILLEKIWGYTSEVETRVTDDNIKRIRKKMNQQGSNVEIVTVWGYGFKLAIKE